MGDAIKGIRCYYTRCASLMNELNTVGNTVNRKYIVPIQRLCVQRMSHFNYNSFSWVLSTFIGCGDCCLHTLFLFCLATQSSVHK